MYIFDFSAIDQKLEEERFQVSTFMIRNSVYQFALVPILNHEVNSYRQILQEYANHRLDNHEKKWIETYQPFIAFANNELERKAMKFGFSYEINQEGEVFLKNTEILRFTPRSPKYSDSSFGLFWVSMLSPFIHETDLLKLREKEESRFNQLKQEFDASCNEWLNQHQLVWPKLRRVDTI